MKRFRGSDDPEFEQKLEDIVGLYLDHPENAIVLSMDEKSQVQALERAQPILPLRPGIPERQTHDYWNESGKRFVWVKSAEEILSEVRKANGDEVQCRLRDTRVRGP